MIIAEGLVSQRSFRAVDPRAPDRDPLHTVTFALQVGSVEPPEAASWLGESVVFERRATRQDADTFVGERVREGDVVRVAFEPRPGVLENPAKFVWGEEITLVEQACGEPR